jgi:hypothetical protein
LPAAGLQVRGQASETRRDEVRVGQGEQRHAGLYGGVQVRSRPAPERRAETVGAVMRDRNGSDNRLVKQRS